MTATVTATATCTAHRGVVEATGRLLNADAVAERVGWLSSIVQDMTARLVAAHWTVESLAALAAGVDHAGRPLPGKGWMALRRLGWASSPPVDIVVSDRVRRMAEEHAARLLRLAVHRDALLRAVVTSWPDNPQRRTGAEWKALWAAGPEAMTKVEARNRTRQAAGFLTERVRLPVSIAHVEAPPYTSGQILAAAADRQQVTHARDRDDPARLALRVLLPAVAQPASYRNWEWIVLDAAIPATVPVSATLLAPALRLVTGRVRVDLPFTRTAPQPRTAGHKQAIGVDWGFNTLLTATTARLGTDRAGRARVTTAGKPLSFDATGASAKLLRLRTVREKTRTRLDHYDRLLTNREDPALTAKRGRLTAEHDRVCARIRHLGKSLAWAAARWSVDHAVAARATVIYIEDLTSMETRGLGRTMNRRLGGHVRGLVFAALTHLAAVEGIAVVTVPARGTSAGCPRCNRHTTEAAKVTPDRRSGFRHVKSPDRPTTSGHKWSACACGLSLDRDHAAAERIAARGLLGQAHARRHRNTGTIHTIKAVDGPVRRVAKNSRDHRVAGRSTTTPLPPSRRETPAPAAAGQRPAGRTPQTPSTITGQVPHTNLRRRRIRDRQASRGFHQHVTATPPHAGTVPRLNLS